jgi:hypothetical protein
VDSAFNTSVIYDNKTAYKGNSLRLDYEIDSTKANPHVIIKLRFMPRVSIHNLDSITFWYKSSGYFDLEITRGGTDTIIMRQVEKRFFQKQQWTKAVVSPMDFAEKLDNELQVSWQEFSSNIINIQFELRKPGLGFFELDELRAHGFLVENLNYFPQ